MIRTILISALIILFITGCKKDNSVEPFNYERDTPQWLKEKIETFKKDPMSRDKVVYRYEWNGKFIYDIYSAASSCMFCEVYEQNGNKVQFTTEAMLQDYIKNRKNEIIVWSGK